MVMFESYLLDWTMLLIYDDVEHHEPFVDLEEVDFIDDNKSDEIGEFWDSVDVAKLYFRD